MMDKIEEVLKLKELLDSGIITEKEFFELKNKVIIKNNGTDFKKSEVLTVNIPRTSKICNNCNSLITKKDGICRICSRKVLSPNDTSSNKEDLKEIENKFVEEEKIEIRNETSFSKNLLYSIVIGVLFIIGGLWFFNHSNGLAKSNIESEAPVLLDSISTVVNQNEWKEDKKEIIEFSSSERYSAVFFSKKEEYDSIFKLSIYKLNKNSTDLIWESSSVEGFRFETLNVLKTNTEALVVAVYNLGGSAGLNNYFVVNIDRLGKVVPDNSLEQYGYVEKTNNSIIITEDVKKIEYKISNNGISKNTLQRDQMSIEGSAEALFRYVDGNIITSNENISLEVGQTIAFIPEDKSTSDLFNKGSISIYTDAWNDDYSFCEANRLKSGNSYTFDKKGTYHFILCDRCIDSENIQPTFTITIN
jgi:hypothetical protein